jgi:hypothetical protein
MEACAMSIEDAFKGLIEKAAGRHNRDKSIETYFPTPSPKPDVDPFSPPPFDIGGPAGQPSGGDSGQQQGSGGGTEAPRK